MPKAGEGGRSRKKAAKKSGKASGKKAARKTTSGKAKNPRIRSGGAGAKKATKKRAGSKKTPSAQGPKPTPCLDSLDVDEAQTVLAALLREQPALRARAERLARDLIMYEGNFEDTAEAVVYEIESLDPEVIGHRTGRSSLGYVEPSEVAWEILDEAFEAFHEDLRRRRQLGPAEGALEDLKGILLGLYRLDHTLRETTYTVLGYAEDWPLAEVSRILETWAMASPGLITARDVARPSLRKRQPLPIDPAFVREHMPAWVDALERLR